MNIAPHLSQPSKPPVLRHAVMALVFATAALKPLPALAITADLARKCEAVVSAAFPPRQIGNPAAGSARGNSKAQREYYSKCVANGGKMEDADKKPPL